MEETEGEKGSLILAISVLKGKKQVKEMASSCRIDKIEPTVRTKEKKKSIKLLILFFPSDKKLHFCYSSFQHKRGIFSFKSKRGLKIYSKW